MRTQGQEEQSEEHKEQTQGNEEQREQGRAKKKKHRKNKELDTQRFKGNTGAAKQICWPAEIQDFK